MAEYVSQRSHFNDKNSKYTRHCILFPFVTEYNFKNEYSTKSIKTLTAKVYLRHSIFKKKT